jgi:hypothetical protein
MVMLRGDFPNPSKIAALPKNKDERQFPAAPSLTKF